MAEVDPYDPCPCGSGQKFKWCCQKVEAIVDRAERLYQGNQKAAALKALDEGLGKYPRNLWLLMRKVVYLIDGDELDAARQVVDQALKIDPKHFGALALQFRLSLEQENSAAGVAVFQRMLGTTEPDERNGLSPFGLMLVSYLAAEGHIPSALKHLDLADQLYGGVAPRSPSVRSSLELSPRVSPWLKNPYALVPLPATGGPESEGHRRFAEALDWANQGLWSASAAAFELISADTDSRLAAAADQNLALSRLWLAEEDAASAALKRVVGRLGVTTDAVDLEALRQEIVPPAEDNLVEFVQWIWPVRDRAGLIAKLESDPTIQTEGPTTFDPEDEESPEADSYLLLDRPSITSTQGLGVEQIPVALGRVLAGQEIVALMGLDDGRLDALSEHFRNLAGSTIAPAHPKTKVLGKSNRETVALATEFVFPPKTSSDEVEQFERKQLERSLRETWPKTPNLFLKGRTPLAAAQAGDAEVPLRALVCRLAAGPYRQVSPGVLEELRARLHLEPEPSIDPESVDIEALHLARLKDLAADRLSDANLVALFRRAKRYGQSIAHENAAKALLERPSAAEVGQIESIELYTDLAALTFLHDDRPGAFEWIRRGRAADPPASRTRNTLAWDLFELRLKAGTEQPETWVPDLAVILDRTRDDREASQKVLLTLVDLGLVKMVPNPDRQGEVYLDSRILEAVLSRYGPRVTTASGRLGVAATRGEIWTPGGESSGGGGGAIWTPGSGTPAPPTASNPAASSPGDRPRLIVPGR